MDCEGAHSYDHDGANKAFISSTILHGLRVQRVRCFCSHAGRPSSPQRSFMDCEAASGDGPRSGSSLHLLNDPSWIASAVPPSECGPESPPFISSTILHGLRAGLPGGRRRGMSPSSPQRSFMDCEPGPRRLLLHRLSRPSSPQRSFMDCEGTQEKAITLSACCGSNHEHYHVRG